MAQILIRQLDEDVKRKLQRRAQRNGRSTEAEVREILTTAAHTETLPSGRLGSRIAARFTEWGLDADIPELRGHGTSPLDFEQ